MVTPEGLAKVLDFGLAKLAGSHGGLELGESDANKAYRARGHGWSAQNHGGRHHWHALPYVLEQAQGGKWTPVPTFSISSVFYEWLARRKAFHGKTGLDTLTAILRSNLSRSPKRAGRYLSSTCRKMFGEVVLCCLRKDPDQRYQSSRNDASKGGARTVSISPAGPAFFRRKSGMLKARQ